MSRTVRRKDYLQTEMNDSWDRRYRKHFKLPYMYTVHRWRERTWDDWDNYVRESSEKEIALTFTDNFSPDHTHYKKVSRAIEAKLNTWNKRQLQAWIKNPDYPVQCLEGSAKLMRFWYWD